MKKKTKASVKTRTKTVKNPKNPPNLILISLSAVLIVSLFLNLYFLFPKKPAAVPTPAPAPVAETVEGTNLVSSIFAPDTVFTGSVFRVVMLVTNTGTEQLKNILPSLLNMKGNAKIEPLAIPPGVDGPVLQGKEARFTWTYSASTMGTLEFKGNAIAEDKSGELTTSLPTKSNMMTVFPARIK